MQNSWEDSVPGWVAHRRMSDAQPQIRLRIHLERRQRHLKGKQQAPRKNQTLKHNSPLMPSSCLSARCELAYGKHGWPLYNSHEKNLPKMKNEDRHNGSAEELTTPSKKVYESRLARVRASVKVNPSDSVPSPLWPPPTTSTNLTSPSSSASNTGSIPAMTSPLNCSTAPRTHSTPSLSAVWDKCRIKRHSSFCNYFLNLQFFFICTSNCLSKRGCQ